MQTTSVTVQSVNPHQFEEYLAKFRNQGFAVTSTGIDTFSALGLKIDVSYSRNQQVVSAVVSYFGKTDLPEQDFRELVLKILDREDATDQVQAKPVMTPLDRKTRLPIEIQRETTTTPEPVKSPLLPATLETLKAIQAEATTSTVDEGAGTPKTGTVVPPPVTVVPKSTA